MMDVSLEKRMKILVKLSDVQALYFYHSQILQKMIEALL